MGMWTSAVQRSSAAGNVLDIVNNGVNSGDFTGKVRRGVTVATIMLLQPAVQGHVVTFLPLLWQLSRLRL